MCLYTRYMTLEHKLKVLSKITGFKELTEHYEHFRDHINSDPYDCCNLRKQGGKRN